MTGIQRRVFLIGSRARYSGELQGIVRDVLRREATLVDNLSEEDSGAGLWGLPPDTFKALDENFLLCPSPPGIRWLIDQQLSELQIEAREALVHPSASVDCSSYLGLGVSVNRLVAIGFGVSVGRHCQINRSASIGHECHIEDFVTIGPGAIIASGVKIRRGAFVGAGAVIIEGLEIGANSVIGAGSVVIQGVEPLTLHAGNPSKLVKRLVTGYKGFSA